MIEPDFIKLPDAEPPDDHQTGVRLIYVLVAILLAVLILGISRHWQP